MRSRALLLVLVITVLSGCRRTPPTPETMMADTPAAMPRGTTWEGTVRVPTSEPAAGKSFGGAWLEAADGQRRVLTYEPESPFHALRDEPVQVEGMLYQPEGQALLGEHLRPSAVRAVNTSASLVYIGPRRTLRGHVGTHVGEPGTKLAGEVSSRFVDSDGVSHPLAHTPPASPPRGSPRDGPLAAERAPLPASDREVLVEAYDVKLSPHTAHLGGEWLWVMGWGPVE